MTPKQPSDWNILLEKLQIFRRSNIAPVDTMGAEAISETSQDHLKSHAKRRKLVKTEKSINEFHTLVGLMLSSQTNDKVTSATVRTLIEDNGLTPESILALTDDRLRQLIGKVGFFNRKTEYLKKVAEIIVNKYKGNIPSTHEELIAFPGVGNKMAHLYLQICHDKVEGISVDVHMHRIAHRWQWVPPSCNTPDKTAAGLQEWLPKEHWKEINTLMVGFGQLICEAKKPKCSICPLAELCPSVRKS